MKAEIITTGTEILLGEIIDTNTAFIAAALATLGIDLYYASTVGDNPERMLGVLRKAWQRSDIIVTTGGLGPSQGDITREAVAQLLGEAMTVDEQLKELITGFFRSRGVSMSPNNIKQAMLIPSARSIPNPNGTAPGWWVEKDGRTVIVMPGPPAEMQPMWRNEVAPRLQQKSGSVIVSLTLKTLNLSESDLDYRLGDLMKASNPTLAMYSRQDGIQVRITAKAAKREEALSMIAASEKAVRSIIGDAVWGTNEDTLEGLSGRLLVENNWSLGVAESKTGGLLTSQLAAARGSAEWFRGGLELNSNEAKMAVGLDTVTVILESDVGTSAKKMAALAREKFKTEVGIGIDGQIDTHGGTMWAAVAHPNGVPAVVKFTGRQPLIVRRIIALALLELIKTLG